jgi:hypothetical protein
MTDQLLNNGFPLDTFYPPNETVDAWAVKYEGHMPHWVLRHLAAEAAKWGADQELEACCEWLDERAVLNGSTALRIARRPKPPSLRKQAYDALDTYIYGEPDPKDKERTYNTIRKALEELPND